ncbi:MAG: cyclic pyranopterin monophosphate synthase MoaC [Alicyclobacillaceae bacterium]|nr:cyclic pyranopterin monophosphate synthase MoaC [Alicyclobacillaceae bacterium]
MVDVSGKPDLERAAVARAVVEMRAGTRRAIEHGRVEKGDVLAIAEVAGIMAAKRTAEWIPLCHPLPLTHASVRCEWLDDEQGTAQARANQTVSGEYAAEVGAGSGDTARLAITARVRTTYRTGVEMEALTACAAAALTVYDMCKALDRGMVVREIRLLEKTRGVHADFRHDADGLRDAP